MKTTLCFVLALTTLATACAKNECELDSDEKKQAFAAIADMTNGGSCLVMNGQDGSLEMISTHGDQTVEAVAGKYKTFLEAQQWKVETQPHKGERSNGKPYEGQILKAEKDGKTALTLVYPLADTLIETVTSVK